MAIIGGAVSDRRASPRRCLALLVLLGTFPLEARAGYEGTVWGMPLAKVQKLYPQGVMVEGGPDGGSTYVIEARFAGLRAIVAFSFVGESGLVVVTQSFAKSGSKVDLRTLNIPPLPNNEADEIIATLRRVLTEKYGKPRWSDDTRSLWLGRDDAVSLQVKREAGDVSVAVVYSGYEVR